MRNAAVVMFLTFFGAITSTTAGAAETTLGRWCNQLFGNSPTMREQITIVVTDQGAAVARIAYGDGSSSRERDLIERGSGVYIEQDSDVGDGYRIVGSTGELELIDNDGYIQSARRLSNTPSPGDCLPVQ